jgi:methylphosphotriester-DNA--protein-cysteine methyltransferase
MQEVANRVLEWDTAFGAWGGKLWERLRNLPHVAQTIRFIEAQLAALLEKNYQDNRLVDFCVKSLELSNGRMTIRDLERKTGYTRRYLELLFDQHVGFPPKVLAGIFRFQKFYQELAHGLSYDLLRAELYDYYYDQAHFTKEFERMTSYSPRRFTLEVPNEFGRRLLLK